MAVSRRMKIKTTRLRLSVKKEAKQVRGKYKAKHKCNLFNFLFYFSIIGKVVKMTQTFFFMSFLMLAHLDPKSPCGPTKYHNLCILHQVGVINAEYISDFSTPSALVEYRWEQEKSPCLTFASFNLSKCTFSGFLKYLYNSAVSTRFLH